MGLVLTIGIIEYLVAPSDILGFMISMKTILILVAFIIGGLISIEFYIDLSQIKRN